MTRINSMLHVETALGNMMVLREIFCFNSSFLETPAAIEITLNQLLLYNYIEPIAPHVLYGLNSSFFMFHVSRSYTRHHNHLSGYHG